jgi:hypothetical protein
MFGRFFLNHPRSVDGNCFEQLLFAGGFALRLLGGRNSGAGARVGLMSV